jgi:hypothetical protein
MALGRNVLDIARFTDGYRGKTTLILSFSNVKSFDMEIYFYWKSNGGKTSHRLSYTCCLHFFARGKRKTLMEYINVI